LGKNWIIAYDRGPNKTLDLTAIPLHFIAGGDRLTEHDLICLRPNYGIDAREYSKVLNMRARVELKAYQKLDWDDLYKDEN